MPQVISNYKQMERLLAELPTSAPADGGLWLNGSAIAQAPDSRPLLLVSIGESNSGGFAANSTSLFPTWENDPRPELLHWVPTGTIGFAPLDIGTNNNLGHGGLDNTTHGWELGIANDVRVGLYGDSPVYYVQTGAGGSLVEWHLPGHFSGAWEQFESRVAGVLATLDNPHIVMLVTLGINNALAGTPISGAAYKAAMISRIAAWRGELSSDALCLLVKLPDFYNATGYSTALQEIADADPTKTKIIEVSGLSISGDHWTDTGYRQIAHRFHTKIVDHLLPTGRKPVTWSAHGDGQFIRIPGTAPQHAYVTESIDLTKPFSIVQEYDPAGGLIVAALAESSTAVNWGSTDDYLMGWYVNGDLFSSYTNGSAAANFGALSTPAWIRVASRGLDLLLQKSVDGGQMWVTLATRFGILTGKTTGYFKVLTVAASGQFGMFWRGDGISVTTAAERPTVILMHGESNAHGEALNSDAQSWELASGRGELQILNNTSMLFESLDVGTNNGGADATKHSWELGLANGLRLGDLPGPVYCVKAAQSGSRIAEWSVNNATGYWSRLLAKVRAAELELGTTDINWVVWNASSVNEQRDAISATNYKSLQISHFQKLRKRLGTSTPIIMLRPPTGFAEYDSAYETAITAIVAELPHTYAIASTGLPVAGDNIHWNYLGTKRAAQLFVEKTQELLGIGVHSQPAVEWRLLENASNVGQEIVFASGAEAGGQSVQSLSNDLPWSVIADFENGADGAVQVAIVGDQAIEYGWNAQYSAASFVWVSGTAYYGDAGNNVIAATGFAYPGKVKFEKSGNNVVISSSTDGGLTWTARHTVTNAVAGMSTLWVRALAYLPDSSKRVRVTIQQ